MSIDRGGYCALLAVVVSVVSACGPKTKGPEIAPLLPDKPVAQTTPDAPTAPAEPAPKPPSGPLQASLATIRPAVKLIQPGRGVRAALKLTPKRGVKQTVELALDFAVIQSAMVDGKRQSQPDIVPTIILGGTAEVREVDAAGRAIYLHTIRTTDARDVPDSRVPLDKFKPLVASVVGLTLEGSVEANGLTSDITAKLATPNDASGQVVELVAMTIPSWPALPIEPVGVGAKWQATAAYKLAGRLDVTHTTDYELIASKGNTWTIKGKVKITGADQTMQGGKITKITGEGTTEATIAANELFPNHKSQLEARFSASEAEPSAGAKPASLDFQIKIASTVKAKSELE